MKKLLCGSVALAAIIAGAPAIAADMPIKAPPVAVASWTGLYVGLGVGFRSTETDVTGFGTTQDHARIVLEIDAGRKRDRGAIGVDCGAIATGCAGCP